MEKTRVAVISVIIENGADTEQFNRLLSSAAPYIIGRMGIPYRQRNVNIISVAIDAPQDLISALSGKIGKIRGISVKTAYSGVFSEDEPQ